MTDLRGESVKRLLWILGNSHRPSDGVMGSDAANELLRRFDRDAATIKKLKAELKRQQKAKEPQSVRRSGRTTRMLEEAEKAARAGRAVYIVAATRAHADDLQSRVAKGFGIKVETASELGNVDWYNLNLICAHPNCILFFDHFAIESKLGPRMLAEIGRWELR